MPAFKNNVASLGTASAAIYTAPAGAGTIITSAGFCNITADKQPKLNITVTAGGVTKYVLFNALVPLNGTLTLKPEVQIILEPGDTLNAWSDVAGAIDAVISATEL